MKASVSPMNCGASLDSTASRYEASSGPCALIALCRLAPPGTKPSLFASYAPFTSPMNSLITLRWKYGGRNVCSATVQRGGKITKTQFDVADGSGGAGGQVKIEGSWWLEVTAVMAV